MIIIRIALSYQLRFNPYLRCCVGWSSFSPASNKDAYQEFSSSTKRHQIYLLSRKLIFRYRQCFTINVLFFNRFHTTFSNIKTTIYEPYRLYDIVYVKCDASSKWSLFLNCPTRTSDRMTIAKKRPTL